MLVGVVGLAREARIFGGQDTAIVVGGGNAALLRQRLSARLDKGARGIISLGIAGALSPLFATGDCIIASAVQASDSIFPADEAWAKRLRGILPHAALAEILGRDSIAATAAEKRRLHARTGAVAVDTESHIVAAMASERAIPYAGLRVIVDTAEQDLPPAAIGAITGDGTINLFSVVRSVIAQPGQISLLLRIGRNSSIAFRELLRCRERLGPRLAAADFP